MRFLGVELYFEDLERAREFYEKTLGLKMTSGKTGHHAQFGEARAFVCLERKGAASYPSRDKAAPFFEVRDRNAAIESVGEERILQREKHWAVLRDAEEHNVLLLDKRAR